MDINNALSRLDPVNEDHWTSNGLPRVDVVENLVGAPVTRQEITDASPDFNRETASAVLTEEDAPQPEHEDELVVFEEQPEEHATNGESVLGMPGSAFARSPDLCKRGLEELRPKLVAARKAVKDAQEDLEKTAYLSSLLTRLLDRQTRSDPEAIHRQNVRAYLDRQAEVSQERGERLKAIHESGVDPRAIVGSLQGSKLDAAMGRKRGFGMKRPEPRQIAR